MQKKIHLTLISSKFTITSSKSQLRPAPNIHEEISISIQSFVRTIAPNGADMPETYNNLTLNMNMARRHAQKSKKRWPQKSKKGRETKDNNRGGKRKKKQNRPGPAKKDKAKIN